MLNLLLDGATKANWITTLMPILRSIFGILMILASITIIVICLATESNAEGGTNAITGNSYESFYSQNKGSTREGRLKRLLIIAGVICLICAILYFLTFKFYTPLV